MVSPQKAAEIAGVSRRTIMVAIESKALKAERNNRNHWRITEEDLGAWMASRSPQVKPAPLEPSGTPTEDDLIAAVLREQLRAAEDEAGKLRDWIEKREADHRVQIEDITKRMDAALAQRNTDYQQALDLLREASRKRGLWELIFGKRS